MISVNAVTNEVASAAIAAFAAAFAVVSSTSYAVPPALTVILNTFVTASPLVAVLVTEKYATAFPVLVTPPVLASKIPLASHSSTKEPLVTLTPVFLEIL